MEPSSYVTASGEKGPLSPEALSHLVSEFIPKLQFLQQRLGESIIGQKNLLQRLLIGLLTEGHILVEGMPGLAKTMAIKSLATNLGGVFGRIQFTPDLLPADLVGTQIYSPKDGNFSVKQGPIFVNFLLADEINRAPAKVQSALLEAMQERQVTIADQTFLLPSPFLVMATQNPLEQEGTYPLPEAQVDRFLLKVCVPYPSLEEEILIAKQYSGAPLESTSGALSLHDLQLMKKLVHQVFVNEKLYGYAASLIQATRNPAAYGASDLAPYVLMGASPRATLSLIKSAKAYAFLQGRAFITPHDMKLLAPDVLRHRLLLSYEAEAKGITLEKFIGAILEKIDVP